ncbi:MAG: hypothetical protein JXX14_22745 [Deltaproteobacteria bacterium]|nr:hypothetical protein [Deltaproteobacteria bacterium]
MLFRFAKSTKITSLTQDAVQTVTGKVVVPKATRIPGTEIQCACYWMMTEHWTQPARKKGRKMWMPQDARQGCSGFFVEDDTGKVWVSDNGDAMDIRNGWEDRGILGKKGTQRFVSRSIKNGDIVKIRGTVKKTKGAEPADCLALRPDDKGLVTVLQKKKSKP